LSSLWSSIIGEIHVLVAALLMFIVMPRWALGGMRRNGNLTARVFSLGLSFWIVVVALLGYAHSVRYSLLFVIALLALIGALWLGPAGRDRESQASSGRMRVWDMLEHPFKAIGATVANLWHDSVSVLRNFLQNFGWLGSALALGAILWALLAGSWPWIQQVGPGTANGYTNLLRIASMASNTAVYSAGAAPTGLSALGASLVTAFFLPPLNVLRFLYPLVDLFTVMAVGVVTHQLTRSGRAAAFVMFIVSVSSVTHLGLSISMESPLAMHWAVVLVLLAVAQTMAWVDSQAPADAFLAALALLAASLMSPPQALAGLMVMAVISLNTGWTLIAWGSLGWVLGVIPVAVGLLLAQPLRPDGWLVAGFPAVRPIWVDPGSSANWMVWVGLAVTLITTIRPIRSRTRHFLWAVGSLALVQAALGWNASVASMVLWSGLLGLLVLIAVVDTVLRSPVANVMPRAAQILIMGGVAAAAAWLPASLPTLAKYDVPLAAATTLHIEQSFPPYEWTIVSPVNQYSEVLSRGWQEELSTFVQTHTRREAANPDYRLRTDARHPILTPDVFVFVEPRLYPTDTPIVRRDLKFAIASGNATYKGRSLMAIEARAYYWARAYLKAHPGSSGIYVHSRNLMVLWIRQ
jgi:hypothetical protein